MFLLVVNVKIINTWSVNHPRCGSGDIKRKIQFG